jgi:opacity protein-like surface antigen
MMTTLARIPLFTPSPLPLLIALSGLPQAAAAAEPGASYFGAHLGMNELGQLGVRVDLGPGKVYDGAATLSNGTHGGLLVGRRSAHARYEFELESGSFRLTHLKAGPVDADANAHGSYAAAFANVYRTARLGDTLEAFAGAGAGWGRIKLHRLGLLHACTCFGPAAKDGFAWQLRGGLDYRLNDTASLGLQYSWLHLQALEAAGPPNVRYERKGIQAWSLAWLQRF